jgi:DNA-binding CsgD family transcriptional regulator
VSVKTIDTYRARIKEKMHLKTANELMRRAVQWVEGESI